MARQVTIQFLGDARSFTSATNTMGRNTSTLGSKLKSLSRAAAIGLAGAAVVATKALWEMGQAAADDELAASKLAAQLKNTTGATKKQIQAVEDWITKVSLATGVTDDELRPALSKLATATGDVTKAQDLLAIAMDVSAGTGKSLDSVTTALQKAQNGSIAGLARLGIKTKDAAGETKSFEQIQKDLAKTFEGQAAVAAETTSGKFARLKVMMQETGEEIGAKLLPYAIQFGDWMLDTGIPAVQRFADWFQKNLSPAIASVAGWFKDTLVPAIADVIAKFRESTGEGEGLGGAMKDLKKFVDDVKRAWGVFGPMLLEAARVYFPVLVNQLKLIAKGLRIMGETGIWLWNNVFSTVIKVILTGFAAVANTVGNTLKIIGEAPKMGWAKELGDKLVNASKKATDLADDIRDIPDSHETVITIRTRHIGQAGGSGGDINSGMPRANGGGLSGGAESLLSGIVKSIKNGKGELGRVLDRVNAIVQSRMEKLKGAMDLRNQFADGFRNFTQSLFSADFTDSETGASTATVTNILDYQKQELAKAKKLATDIQKLVGMGLSKDLLEQLQSSGASGIAQIGALASASAAQIAELNALNAGTMGTLTGAGMTAGNSVYGAQIQTAKDNLAEAKEIKAVLQQIRDDRKGDKGTVTVKGTDIVIALKRLERATGTQILAG
jgi:hypothetical protein